MNMKRIVVLFFLGMVWCGRVCAQTAMSQDEFMAQVAQYNPEVLAARQSFEALGTKMLEMDTMYGTYLIGAGAYSDDRSGLNFNSAFQAKDVSVTAYSLGVAKKLPTGTAVSLAYAGSITNLDLYAPIMIPGYGGLFTTVGAYSVKPTLSVTQSLLKDGKNGQTQATITRAKALARAGQYGQLFALQQALIKARMAYLNLSLAREVVAFRRSSMERAARVLEWTRRRVNLDLAEQTDLLQAQAGYQLRQLNLQVAEEEALRASRSFNEARGAAGAATDVALEKIDALVACCDTRTPERRGERADVHAAREQLTAAILAEREASLRLGAELTAFGSTAFSGLALEYGDANEQAFSFDKPTYTVGLNLSVPLGYALNKNVREGYRKDVVAARQHLAQTQRAADNAWDDLAYTWRQVKERLSLAQEIMAVQGKRVENEQQRYQRGRATTYQVLNAENDLDDATLGVYRLMFEELLTMEQAALYQTTRLP